MEKLTSKNVTKSLGLLRTAVLAALGIPFLLATAHAQTPTTSPAAGLPEAGPPPAGAEATVERITVTGSNIPTAEEVTASPVDTINAGDISDSGASTSDVLEVLQKRNPDFTGGGNLGSTNANVASGATQGGSVVSVRGLPTLVLFEGRRIADSAAISSGGFQFTDVSIFPVTLISDIQVLKDGASAIYGSEAVGGVVNIFLKDDFQGAEIAGRYGFTVSSAVAERRADVIAGFGTDTTHVTVGFQYYEIDPLFSRERGYSRPAINLTTTYAGVGRDDLGGGTNFYLLKPGLNSPFDAPGVIPGGVPPPAGTGTANPGQYAQIPQAYDNVSFGQILDYDLSKLPTSTLDISNTDAYGSFSHDIFGKQLQVFGNFLYAHNHNESQLNAQPLSNGTGVVIPAGRVGSDNDVSSPGYIPGVTNTIYNPFSVQIDDSTLSGDARLFANNRYQNHPRTFTDDSNFYRFLGGLRSAINKDWNAEAATYYSQYNIDFVNQNLVNAQQLNAMIAGTAFDFNGNPIPALDFFARNPIGTGPGQVTAAQFNTAFGSNIRSQSSYQEVFDGKVNGFPLHLPGGDVGVAFGGEYRQEGFKLVDSPEIFVGSVPVQNIDVGRNIESAYAEIDIPFFGPEQKIAGLYGLELDLAGRYDHYEGVSKDAKVPKVSLRYQPIQDITLRATYANSFVAPNLFELFGPSSSGFSPTITLNGVQQDQAQVLTGANPHLIPSTAESYTGGVVYSPHQLPGLTVTADYFRTLQQLIVGNNGAAAILTSVNNLGPASPYAGQVAFNNFPGFPGAVPVTAPGQLAGNLASVFYTDPLVNVGAERVSGFDFTVHYNWDLRTWGQAEFGANAVLYSQAELKRLPDTRYYNIQGIDFAEGGGAFPDYKLTFLSRYTYGGATVAFNADYIPGLINGVGGDPETDDTSRYMKIGDYLTVDGRLEYAFRAKPAAPAPAATSGYSKDAKDAGSNAGSKNPVAGANTTTEGGVMSVFDRVTDGLTVAVGCNNIFDRVPPTVNGANSNTDLSLYDPYGRFLYFEISKKF